jgi:hypothetical protein
LDGVILMSGSYDFYQDYWNYYHSVTFDGPNKLILVNNGVTELDVKVDLYSDWKEWARGHDGVVTAKYLQAMRGTGGDPLPGDRFLGDTYFLTNGWRIKPYQGSYRLSINGNLYTEEGDSPFVDADGLLNNIRIESTVSTLVNTVGVGVGTPAEVADAVWSEDLEPYEDQDDTAGQDVKDIKRNTGLIPATL